MSDSKVNNSDSTVSAIAGAFSKYAPALHRYLLRRIRRGSDVADLTQEIFERFLRVPLADSIKYPQAYLFRIASHVVSDALLRDEQALITYDSKTADKAAENIELATPDDMSERMGFAQELQRVLTQLPDMHRAVILLSVRDGLSHKEVARRTGLSVSTVGVYVCEARARIRTILNASKD